MPLPCSCERERLRISTRLECEELLIGDFSILAGKVPYRLPAKYKRCSCLTMAHLAYIGIGVLAELKQSMAIAGSDLLE
jgi:hypothetical protein